MIRIQVLHKAREAPGRRRLMSHELGCSVAPQAVACCRMAATITHVVPAQGLQFCVQHAGEQFCEHEDTAARGIHAAACCSKLAPMQYLGCASGREEPKAAALININESWGWVRGAYTCSGASLVPAAPDVAECTCSTAVGGVCEGGWGGEKE